MDLFNGVFESFLKVGCSGPDSVQLYGKGQPAKSSPVLGKLLKKSLPLQITNYFFKILIWLHYWLLHLKSINLINNHSGLQIRDSSQFPSQGWNVGMPVLFL